jgi:hypothetical protein
MEKRYNGGQTAVECSRGKVPVLKAAERKQKGRNFIHP